MRKIKFILIFLLLFVTLCISACGADSPQPVTNPKPEPGKGGIVGAIEIPSQWENSEVFVYLAKFYSSVDGGGNFILEPNQFPKTVLGKSGQFALNNLEPGNYVLIVGPIPEIGKLVMKEGETLIVEVKADQVNELVDLYLAN